MTEIKTELDLQIEEEERVIAGLQGRGTWKGLQDLERRLDEKKAHRRELERADNGGVSAHVAALTDEEVDAELRTFGHDFASPKVDTGFALEFRRYLQRRGTVVQRSTGGRAYLG